MINIAVTSREHISTIDYFKQFPGMSCNFCYCDDDLRLKKNFVSFPKRFAKKNNIDLIHIKNYTILNKINWITEHEHGYNLLPLTRKRLRLLLSPYCKKITFYSNYAKSTALSFLENVDIDSRNRILAKSTIIAPAAFSREKPHEYAEKETLNLLFVGNEFIRKGGISVWEAFNTLKNSYDIKLTLISNFSEVPAFRVRTLPGYPDYGVLQKRLDKLVAGENSRVRIMRNLAREEVIKVQMPQADIFLAPTFADSFGISTIEAMSEGLPIIASNINAIPEMISHEKEGLLIDNSMGAYPLVNNSFHMKHSWHLLRSDPDSYCDYMTAQVKHHLIQLLENRTRRENLGRNAKEKFENNFSFSVRSEKFYAVYKEAVAI